MKFKKTLTSIVFAGTLGLSGCDNNYEYHFDGKIGEEQVSFYELGRGNYNVLEVIKADGNKVMYMDRDNDFKLDFVKITVGENTTKYDIKSSNPIVGEVIQRAQKEFDLYLSKITDIQTAPLNKE